MSSTNSKIFLGLCAFLIIAFGLFMFTRVNKSPVNNGEKANQAEISDNQLKIIATNPNPLDDATILPTQSIEITFNKIIPKSEFKHEFSPEIPSHEVEALNGPDANNGSVMKINFKEPLQLGAGYSLTISSGTRTGDGKSIDKEYIYHFKTIQYKGV